MGEKMFSAATIEVPDVGEVKLTIQQVTPDNEWETSGDAMRVMPIDYQVADVFLTSPKALKE